MKKKVNTKVILLIVGAIVVVIAAAYFMGNGGDETVGLSAYVLAGLLLGNVRKHRGERVERIQRVAAQVLAHHVIDAQAACHGHYGSLHQVRVTADRSTQYAENGASPATSEAVSLVAPLMRRFVITGR